MSFYTVEPERDYFKPTEVAIMAKESVRNIYHWMKVGKLKYIQVGKIKRIPGWEVLRITGLEKLPSLEKPKPEEKRGIIIKFGSTEVNVSEDMVYILKAENGFTKIGISSGLDVRLSGLYTMIPLELHLVAVVITKDAEKRERELHEMFKEKRFKGEWFTLDESDMQRLELCMGYVSIDMSVPKVVKTVQIAQSAHRQKNTV